MGWEQRGNNRYYYRKRRIGRRVVSEYVGTGAAASLAEQRNRLARSRRDSRRQVAKDKRAEMDASEGELVALDKLISDLVSSILLTDGFHTHKREWRRKRESNEQQEQS